MLNKAAIALAATLTMACATAQAATVTTLSLNYSLGGVRDTNFQVLGLEDYLSSTGRSYVPFSASLAGGVTLPEFLIGIPGQTVAALLGTIILPHPPGGGFQPQANLWQSNVGGPPGIPIFVEAFGGLTEDYFSLRLLLQCGLGCDYPVTYPFAVTFTTPDSVSIIATPIPAALPMFAAGLGLLWFGRRRARRAAEGASQA